MSTSNAGLRLRPRALIVAMALAAVVMSIAAASASAAVRHFDGKVLSKDASAQTFKVRTEGGAKKTFQVSGATEFERIPGGFSGLEQGLRVEVDAKKTDGGLLAKQVEKDRNNGGGGNGGGGGNDDGPNHH